MYIMIFDIPEQLEDVEDHVAIHMHVLTPEME